jgi:TonB family protein
MPSNPNAMLQVPAPTPAPPSSVAGHATGGGGSGVLGDALSNLGRYVQRQQFDNPGGAGQPGAAIQFDTKGVEFGPWLRRFVAQIKRNWFVPYAAMSMKGHVIITFNVHKNGAITDLTVVGPCPIDAFNNAAFGALVASNPTTPLPPEYPDEKAFFTVTFYYNEGAPDR